MLRLLLSLITDLVQAEPTLYNLEVNKLKLRQNNKGSGRAFISTELKNKIL